MYFVYILQSLKDKMMYVGFTESVERRITEHDSGQVESTKHRRPLRLVCYEAYLTKSEALKREEYLKSSDGKKDIRRRLSCSLEK